MEALHAVAVAAQDSEIPEQTLTLVQVRASQINGDSASVDLQSRRAKLQGETKERLLMLPAWRDSPYYSEAERAGFS